MRKKLKEIVKSVKVGKNAVMIDKKVYGYLVQETMAFTRVGNPVKRILLGDFGEKLKLNEVFAAAIIRCDGDEMYCDMDSTARMLSPFCKLIITEAAATKAISKLYINISKYNMSNKKKQEIIKVFGEIGDMSKDMGLYFLCKINLKKKENRGVMDMVNAGELHPMDYITSQINAVNKPLDDLVRQEVLKEKEQQQCEHNDEISIREATMSYVEGGHCIAYPMLELKCDGLINSITWRFIDNFTVEVKDVHIEDTDNAEILLLLDNFVNNIRESGAETFIMPRAELNSLDLSSSLKLKEMIESVTFDVTKIDREKEK